MTRERIAEKAYAYLKLIRGPERQRIADSNGIVAVWDDDKDNTEVNFFRTPNTVHISFSEIGLWMMTALDRADFDISRLHYQIEMQQQEIEHLKRCLDTR
jgi:hypothetical protein